MVFEDFKVRLDGGSPLGQQRPFLDEAKKTRLEALWGQREGCYHFAREGSEKERLEDKTLISVDDSLRTDFALRTGVSAPPRPPRSTTHTSAAKAPTQNLWVFPTVHLLDCVRLEEGSWFRVSFSNL